MIIEDFESIIVDSVDPLEIIEPRELRKGVMFQFEPGLVPTFKHVKHDQKTHGSWAVGSDGGGEFDRWGDRKDALIKASGIGPTREDLDSILDPDESAVTDEEIRVYVYDTYGSGINAAAMNDWMDAGYSFDQDGSREKLKKFQQDALDLYVNNFGESSRSDIATQNVDFDEIEPKFKDVFNVEHTGVNKNGDTIEVVSRVQSVGSGYDKLSVIGALYDSRGNDIGEFDRTFSKRGGKTIVTHELLNIWDEENQGSGFAKVFNKQAEDYYISHGIETIKIHASLGRGGYTWAQAGYGWDTDRRKDEAVGNVPQRIKDYLLSGSVGSFSAANEIKNVSKRFDLPFDDPDFPTPTEVANIGRTDGATTWAGKDILMAPPGGSVSSDWYGQKILKPPITP